MIEALSPMQLRKAYDLTYEYGLSYFITLTNFEKKQVGKYTMKIFQDQRILAAELVAFSPDYNYQEILSDEGKVDYFMEKFGQQIIAVRDVLIAYNDSLKNEKERTKKASKIYP